MTFLSCDHLKEKGFKLLAQGLWIKGNIVIGYNGTDWKLFHDIEIIEKNNFIKVIHSEPKIINYKEEIPL